MDTVAGAGAVEDDVKPKSTVPEAPSVPSSSIIVFHPGSRHLRFGRASDSVPHTILNAIGRRRKKHSSGVTQILNRNLKYRDSQFPIDNRSCEKLPPEVESARLQLCHTLQTSLKSDGSSRFATDLGTIASYNKISNGIPADCGILTDNKWDDFLDQEIIIGNDVLKVNPEGDFNIHFPWRRGQLNLHKDVGGSLSSLMSDLEDIWKYCLTKKLGITLESIKNFRVVVVVPTIFDKGHAKEVMNVLLKRIGFGHAFLIQDHVCATFGAGLACATVVDVGDQKISVSCIDDGVSCPQSRIELKYGGGDLTIAFWNLINQAYVPFMIDLRSFWDMEFMNKLKERLCHFDLDRCGPEEHTVLWNIPNFQAFKFRVYFGDELLIVPLSYFNPDLLRGSIGSKAVVVSRSQPSVADDPFDALYITDTSRKGLKEMEDGQEDDLEDSKDELALSQKSQYSKIDTDNLLGIDQAILQSIESCSFGEDIKRRLYSCVLVVGGGFKFQGLGSWLEKKINMNIPRTFKTEAVEVITRPKEGDPSVTVWKGATILATLESAVELWIERQEWKNYGTKLLRERSLFTF